MPMPAVAVASRQRISGQNHLVARLTDAGPRLRAPAAPVPLRI
jgi:hypothetical protein